MNIIIVGAGKLGAGIAKQLCDEDHNITMIDVDESRLDRLTESLDVRGVCGSGTHCDALEEAQVKSANLVIAVTAYDENNILSCLIAKKMGARHTIARVRNPEYSSQIDFMRAQLGVSMMVNPDQDAALEITRILQLPNAIKTETFADGRADLTELKIEEGSPFCNKPISEVSQQFWYRILICAVMRGEEVIIPNGNFVLLPGDRVHITGSHSELIYAARFFSSDATARKTKSGSSVRRVMIFGGSRIAVYLAKMLTVMGKSVTIIEKNAERCEFLCEQLSGVTVINSDANDHDALLEDGLNSMDAVITLTDTDETNFIISMYSETLGVPCQITKINNQSLSKMIDNMGKNSPVNVTEIAANKIAGYIRTRKSVEGALIKSLYTLADGKIEAIEFEVTDSVSFLDTPICKLKLKDGILIAVILRSNRVIIPCGNDVLLSGDAVVIVSKGRKLERLNDILK